MTQDTSKKYPSASGEIAKIFGLSEEEDKQPKADFNHEPAHAVGDLPVANLPTVSVTPKSVHTAPKVTEKDVERAQAENQPAEPKYYADPAGALMKDLLGVKPSQNPVKGFLQRMKLVSVISILVPYILIFILGLGMYFFFFSKVDFGSLFKSTSTKPVTAKETLLLNLEKQNEVAYNKWIAGFYYDVSDTKVLDPNVDNSGNGLTNFQKFLLNLNPRSYDTLGLGMADSEALAQGINPLTGNKLTDAQKQVLEKYFDMEVIMNKLTLAKMKKGGVVAGAYAQAGTSGTPTTTTPPPYQQDPSIVYADLDINTDVPGRLEIPSLKVNAPLMWSKDPAQFDQDLKSGVIHYPGTAMPGQIGTSYISGHSSNYAWVKGDYNQVFSKLGNLPDNSSFKITVVQRNGKDAILHYVVVGRKEYKPDDQAQFQNVGKSAVALSTCWPIGTTQRRLVVFGQLTQVEK